MRRPVAGHRRRPCSERAPPNHMIRDVTIPTRRFERLLQRRPRMLAATVAASAMLFGIATAGHAAGVEAETRATLSADAARVTASIEDTTETGTAIVGAHFSAAMCVIDVSERVAPVVAGGSKYASSSLGGATTVVQRASDAAPVPAYDPAPPSPPSAGASVDELEAALDGAAQRRSGRRGGGRRPGVAGPARRAGLRGGGGGTGVARRRAHAPHRRAGRGEPEGRGGHGDDPHRRARRGRRGGGRRRRALAHRRRRRRVVARGGGARRGAGRGGGSATRGRGRGGGATPIVLQQMEPGNPVPSRHRHRRPRSGSTCATSVRTIAPTEPPRAVFRGPVRRGRGAQARMVG